MHGLGEVEEAARSERLQAWVASLTSPGPRAAAALPPPRQRLDLSRTQLFSSWEAWTQFLSAPPAVPALSRVLDAVVRIARLIDVRAPVNAPAIVAAIARAKEHRAELSHARDSLLTLKFLAVTDALQHLYTRIPRQMLGNKDIDLNAVAAFARVNSGVLSRVESEVEGGFVRVTSEYLPNVPREIAEFAEAASLSLEGKAPSALRMNFDSVLSLGRSEPSTNTLGDDVGRDVGMRGRSNVVPSWSTVALNVPSAVELAAGGLYCADAVDDLWQIGDAIGAGSFSDVHYVTCVKDGTRAAIKIVCKGAPDLFTHDGVCREIAAFSRIGRHESVVNCLQVFEDDRFVYIVMELLTGGQLLPRVSDASYYGMYSETDARNVAYGIARGLAHCHALGIAHRDVKPDNILFVSESDHSHVKLTDFGIAHIVQPGEEGAMDMVGTPLYVAPEVLLQKPYGCAADMWSLGVIVHILLTGFPPFDDDNIVLLINKVKSAVLEFNGKEWDAVSHDAKDFIVRLLCRDPRQRLTATQALSHPWLEKMGNLSFSERRNSKVLPSRQTSLQSVQTNLRTFVKRKDSRPHIGSSHKLSLLVSLSERTLKGSTSEVSNRYSNESRERSRRQLGRLMAHTNANPATATDIAATHHSYHVRALGGTGMDEKKSKGISSPRRRPIRSKGRTNNNQESQLNHSEFRPSYVPIDDSTTEKLHEMVDISAPITDVTPASPKSMPSSTPGPPATPVVEQSSKKTVTAVSTSLSTTTSTPPVSDTSIKVSSPNVDKFDDMDQSNILLVRLDESLLDRRQADADLDSPAKRAKQGLLRASNRSSRKRSKSRNFRTVFRRVDSPAPK